MSESRAPTTGWTSRLSSALDGNTWAVLALIPLIALVVLQWGIPPLASAGDYAQYLLHAQALADGRPYDDTGYIFTPFNWGISPRVQPPVWPILLAPVVKAFGPLGMAPKIMAAVAMAGFLLTAGRYFAAREGSWLGVIVAVAVGLGLESAYALTAPISDLPFAVFFWLTLWLGDDRKEWTWGRLAALGALAALAAGTRVVGVALGPAIVLAAMFRSPAERRRALILGGGFAVVAVAALLTFGDQVPFAGFVLREREFDLAETARRMWVYRFAFFETALYPTRSNALNDAYHIAAALLTLLGSVSFVRRYGRTLLGTTVVCYAALLLVAPVSDVRYSWPLWPVAVVAYAFGARQVLQWLRFSPGAARLLVASVFLVISIAAARTAATRPRPPNFLDLADTQELFGWFRAHPGRDTLRVVFGSPRVFALYTGIASMSPFGGRSPDETREELDRRRITHVVGGGRDLMDSPGHVERSVVRFVPPWMPVFENSRFRVLERPAGSPAPSGVVP